MFDVTAIITTMDNLPMLCRQVPILLEECVRVIVVNNGSLDGTKEWLDENVSDRVIAINRQNLGAGPGRNAGLAKWDENPTEYTLMLDGGILPLHNGVKVMLEYMEANPDVEVISPEVMTCFTTSEEKADRYMLLFTREHCFPQRALSSTAYALCRKSAWRVRFNEEGPYGQPGWGVDDNDMAFRWNRAGVLHQDFQGPMVYRRQSGSFKRLEKETGVWPNGYGSVFEQRYVKLNQDWPEYLEGLPEVSCVVCAWNEWPMIGRAVKLMHEELKDIKHEIIVVNNGSTDDTNWWLDTFALRQPHGDKVIDTRSGEVLVRSEHPELEYIWTGNIVRIDFPENVGISKGTNAAFARARGKYIFLTDGDMLVVRNSMVKLLDALKDLEAKNMGDWVEVNPWVCQGENDNPDPVPDDFTFIDGSTPRNGLGDYAGGYAFFNRKILDAGCKHPEDGPWQVVGAGYEDADLANQMYSKGFKGWMYNYPGYYHPRRDFHRSGHVDETLKFKNLQDRCDRVLARWAGSTMLCTYWHNQPPPRHRRRVAVISGEKDPTAPGTGYFALWALKQICDADMFFPGEEPEGYDDYLYLIDYVDAEIKYHPAVMWAVDLNDTDWYFAPPKQRYLDYAPKFDRIFVAHSFGVRFFKEHNFDALLIPYGCWPEIHHPCPEVEKDVDWVAVCHNAGPRVELFDKLMKVIPNGKISYSWWKWYSPEVARGLCTINKSRLGELTMRVFENMAMGVPLVTDRVPELAEYFEEDKHYLGYDDVDELVEKIRWVKSHQDEASAMAERARKLVVENYTYYHSMLRMFGEWGVHNTA